MSLSSRSDHSSEEKFPGLEEVAIDPPSPSPSIATTTTTTTASTATNSLIGGLKTYYLRSLKNMITGVSAFSPPKVNAMSRSKDEDAARVNRDVLELVKVMADQRDWWNQFNLPLQRYDGFCMSEAQKRHASYVEELVPSLAELRLRLCPHLMKDAQFWMMYFCLVYPLLSEREIGLLITPEIDELRRVVWENRSSADIEGSADTPSQFGENALGNYPPYHPDQMIYPDESDENNAPGNSPLYHSGIVQNGIDLDQADEGAPGVVAGPSEVEAALVAKNEDGLHSRSKCNCGHNTRKVLLHVLAIILGELIIAAPIFLIEKLIEKLFK